jgi:hypothetical protein
MNSSHPHSGFDSSSLMKRRVRWLVTFKHTILLDPVGWWDSMDPQPVAFVGFEEGSESVVYIRDSKASMPGFGELKVKEAEHFKFIDTFSS